MRLTLNTWNGKNINSGNYTATILPGSMFNLSSQAVYVDRAEEFPYMSGVVLPAHSFTFGIQLAQGVTDIASAREVLAGWFSILDFQPHKLIGTDENAVQWYLSGFPIRLVKDPTVKADTAFYITLAVADPVWRAVTATADTWNITATGQQHTVAIGGNTYVRPKIAFTPTGAKATGLQYSRWVAAYNKANVALTNYPMEIAGGLNTQALVTAVKMQASGNDLRVTVDGPQANRWVDGINTTSTKVWIVQSWSPAQIGTLLGTLPNNGTTVSVTFKQTTANLAVLKALQAAKNPVFIIGTEAFMFSASNVDLTNYKITSCTRAQKGTSFAAHADGDNINWVEHDIWIQYGDATLGAPDVSDTLKPLLDLHNSTNLSWVQTQFYDTTSARPGAWAGSITTSIGKQSVLYYGDQEAAANPATELGMSLRAFISSGVWRSETAGLVWTMNHPVGITTVSMSGKKYALVNSPWAVYIGLGHSSDGINWSSAHWTEAAPANNTWTAWTHNAVALGATYNYIGLILYGSCAASANNKWDFQGDTVTLALDATRAPSTSLGSETSAWSYNNTKITNTTTGDYLTFTYPSNLNRTITIDCEAKTVTLDDGTNIFGSMVVSTIRNDWLNLQTGNNVLQIDDSGIGNATLVTTFTNKTIP